MLLLSQKSEDDSIYVWNLVVGVHKCGEKVGQSETSNCFLLFFNENKVDFQAKSLFFYY